MFGKRYEFMSNVVLGDVIIMAALPSQGAANKICF